jgi:DNA-binding response OmpR family regulator
MGPRLLLVESEINLRRKISEFLGAAGYSITEAARGRDALDLLATARFDLIIADAHLMDGLSGREVLAYGEALQSGIIAVLLGPPRELSGGPSMDATFITKPVRLDWLRLKLGLLLIQTRGIQLSPATRTLIAQIRSQRVASVIHNLRFEELSARLQQAFLQNSKLREEALELTKQLQQMLTSTVAPVSPALLRSPRSF